jgi:ribosomal protein L11 methyltransferase
MTRLPFRWSLEITFPWNEEILAETLFFETDLFIALNPILNDQGWRLTYLSSVLPNKEVLVEMLLKIDPEIVSRTWRVRPYKEPVTCKAPLPCAPQYLGSFYIHDREQKSAIESKTHIPLEIHAATAFGSGHHETTRGCLHLIEDVYQSAPWAHALDLGCGSGILALVMAKLIPQPVWGIDIDPEAVRVSKEHAKLNRVQNLTTFLQGEAPPASMRFDLIAANILANPLKQLAPLIRESLCLGGQCILSGFLKEDMEDVLNTYQRQGLRFQKHVVDNNWVSLLLALPKV